MFLAFLEGAVAFSVLIKVMFDIVKTTKISVSVSNCCGGCCCPVEGAICPLKPGLPNY